MTQAEFSRAVMGHWDDKRTRQIEDLAAEYEDTCEAYDRTVCSGNRNGVAIPANPHEQGLINRNARKVRDAIMSRAVPLGISWHEISDVLRSKP